MSVAPSSSLEPHARGAPLPLPTCALAFGLLLAAGCGAAAPGFEMPVFSVPASEDGCLTRVAWVEHADEPTALGFSALDVLTHLGGGHGAPLEWLEPEPSEQYLISYGPERGRSSLAIDVRARDGQILHRYREPLLSAPEGTECGDAVLEVPVEVTLSSGGNALAESFDAVLTASVPYRGHISKQLEPRRLYGALDVARVDSLDPERLFSLAALSFDAELWPGGSRGSLGVQLESRYARPSKELRPAPEAPSPAGPLAVWPSARACDGARVALPSDALVLGFSARDVLERLRQGGPRQLTWLDGSVTPVQLTPAELEPELCQELGASLTFDGVLRAESVDGKLGVNLPVTVDASDAGGSIGEINIASSGPAQPHPVAELARERRSLVRVGDYDAVLVGVRWSLGAEGDSGELSLRGVDGETPDAEGNYPSTALTSARW